MAHESPSESTTPGISPPSTSITTTSEDIAAPIIVAHETDPSENNPSMANHADTSHSHEIPDHQAVSIPSSSSAPQLTPSEPRQGSILSGIPFDALIDVEDFQQAFTSLDKTHGFNRQHPLLKQQPLSPEVERALAEALATWQQRVLNCSLAQYFEGFFARDEWATKLVNGQEEWANLLRPDQTKFLASYERAKSQALTLADMNQQFLKAIALYYDIEEKDALMLIKIYAVNEGIIASMIFSATFAETAIISRKEIHLNDLASIAFELNFIDKLKNIKNYVGSESKSLSDRFKKILRITRSLEYINSVVLWTESVLLSIAEKFLEEGIRLIKTYSNNNDRFTLKAIITAHQTLYGPEKTSEILSTNIDDEKKSNILLNQINTKNIDSLVKESIHYFHGAFVLLIYLRAQTPQATPLTPTISSSSSSVIESISQGPRLPTSLCELILTSYNLELLKSDALFAQLKAVVALVYRDNASRLAYNVTPELASQLNSLIGPMIERKRASASSSEQGQENSFLLSLYQEYQKKLRITLQHKGLFVIYGHLDECIETIVSILHPNPLHNHHAFLVLAFDPDNAATSTGVLYRRAHSDFEQYMSKQKISMHHACLLLIQKFLLSKAEKDNIKSMHDNLATILEKIKTGEYQLVDTMRDKGLANLSEFLVHFVCFTQTLPSLSLHHTKIIREIAYFLISINDDAITHDYTLGDFAVLSLLTIIVNRGGRHLNTEIITNYISETALDKKDPLLVQAYLLLVALITPGNPQSLAKELNMIKQVIEKECAAIETRPTSENANLLTSVLVGMLQQHIEICRQTITPPKIVQPRDLRISSAPSIAFHSPANSSSSSQVTHHELPKPVDNADGNNSLTTSSSRSQSSASLAAGYVTKPEPKPRPEPVVDTVKQPDNDDGCRIA